MKEVVSPFMQNDHVTKTEFREFETRVDDRFTAVNKQFDSFHKEIASQFGEFRNEIRKDLLLFKDDLAKHITKQFEWSAALWREKVQHDFKTSTEMIGHRIDQKVDKKEFERRVGKIEKRLPRN